MGVANKVVEAERVGGSDQLVQPVEHETADRVITGLVTAVPFLLLSVAAWQVCDAGATAIVAGSHIFHAPDYAAAIAAIRRAAAPRS